jgi:hypothetical protein
LNNSCHILVWKMILVSKIMINSTQKPRKICSYISLDIVASCLFYFLGKSKRNIFHSGEE